MSDVLDRSPGRNEMEMRQFLEAEIPPGNLGAAECTVLPGGLRRMPEQDAESRRFGWRRAAAYAGLGERASREAEFGNDGRRLAGVTPVAELRRRRAVAAASGWRIWRRSRIIS